MGVKIIAARLGTKLPNEQSGHLFEGFVGLELLRNLRYLSPRGMFEILAGCQWTISRLGD
jgi:hypothetical protein